MLDPNINLIDYASEAWHCPRCDIWVPFKDNQSCPGCKDEAPEPVFQWNARRLDKKSKFVLKAQMKTLFYTIGIGLFLGLIVGFIIGAAIVLPIALGFLLWVIILNIFTGKGRNGTRQV